MSPRLDIRHLQMLAAIAREGNVTRAADTIGLTQSALTHRIREAERRLGTALYTRVGKGLRATPAGETLTAVAERVLGDLERAEHDAVEMSVGVEHVMRIGVGTYTRYHWLPPFLETLKDSAPGLQVEIFADAMQRPLEMLLDGTIDIAIVATESRPPGITWIPLFTDELIAITPVDHRFAKCPYVDAEALRDEVWITYGTKTEPGFESERFMRPARVWPKRFLRVELPEAIVELVRAGMGVSILSRWAVEPYLRAGTLASTRLGEKGLDIDWFAAVRASDGEGSPAHRLAASLAAWCETADGGFHMVAGMAH